MMADNDWSPEDLKRKVKELANSSGTTDRAKLEAIQVLVSQYADQSQVKQKQESE